MHLYEWIAAAYFGALALAALFTRAPRGRRVTVIGAGLAAALLVGVVASTGGAVLRVWLPHVYLVTGYWIPALLARAPAHATRLEQWLVRSDVVLRRTLVPMPALLVHLTELAYLLCYPLVPASFAVVWTAGVEADVVRFWVAVLVAGYACYVPLPWLLSRPPRLAGELAHAPSDIGAVNVFVLGRVSHQLNTFPSGHVAVSLAAATGVWAVSPVAGGLVAAAGMAIALGAVSGRYHYVLDVVLGVFVAGAAAWFAFAAVP